MQLLASALKGYRDMMRCQLYTTCFIVDESGVQVEIGPEQAGEYTGQGYAVQYSLSFYSQFMTQTGREGHEGRLHGSYNRLYTVYYSELDSEEEWWVRDPCGWPSVTGSTITPGMGIPNTQADPQVTGPQGHIVGSFLVSSSTLSQCLSSGMEGGCILAVAPAVPPECQAYLPQPLSTSTKRILASALVQIQSSQRDGTVLNSMVPSVGSSTAGGHAKPLTVVVGLTEMRRGNVEPDIRQADIPWHTHTREKQTRLGPVRDRWFKVGYVDVLRVALALLQRFKEHSTVDVAFPTDHDAPLGIVLSNATEYDLQYNGVDLTGRPLAGGCRSPMTSSAACCRLAVYQTLDPCLEPDDTPASGSTLQDRYTTVGPKMYKYQQEHPASLRPPDSLCAAQGPAGPGEDGTEEGQGMSQEV